MSLSRRHPVHIEAVQDYSDQFSKEIESLVKRVRQADDDNSGWLRRQLEYTKMLYGKRKRRNVPWVGASNVNVPLIDGILRRWKPGIASLVLDANPVAFFVGRTSEGIDASRKVEPFFHWLFAEHMQTAREVVKLTHLIGLRGHAYVREGWKYKTSKECRVDRVESLFPEGIQTFIQAAAQDPETRDVNPLNLIMQRLATRYELAGDTPQEQIMLQQAAAALLSGADRVKIVFESVEEDRPDWRAVDPIYVITEKEGLPEESEFFVVIHRFTSDQLRRMARDGELDIQRVEQAIEKSREGEVDAERGRYTIGGPGGASLREQFSQFMRRRAGMTDMVSRRQVAPRMHVWEMFCKLDLDGDGLAERCVVWYAPTTDTVLAARPYVLPFDEWPITTYFFEGHAETPYDSRGIPEMLQELAKLVNAYHNSRIDAAQIVLAPVFQERATGTDLTNQITWRPGARIPVRAVGDIAPIPTDLRVLQGLLIEEQENKAVAESYIGTFDATINQLSQPTERRTAAEIQAITQLAQNVFGLDARLFQLSMARSFKKIWKLWMDLGPENVFFAVQGEEQPTQINKIDIDREYNISPAGSPTSTNRAFLMSSMERILQTVMADTTGQIDVGELLKKYLELIDYNLARAVVRPPEQTAAAQQVMEAAARLQEGEFFGG